MNIEILHVLALGSPGLIINAVFSSFEESKDSLLRSANVCGHGAVLSRLENCWKYPNKSKIQYRSFESAEDAAYIVSDIVSVSDTVPGDIVFELERKCKLMIIKELSGKL